MIPSRTWKKVGPEAAERVRQLLARLGTSDEKLSGVGEAWRVRVEGSVFTQYASGTLVFTGGEGPRLVHIVDEVSRIITDARGPVGRDCLIGLDESGKSEVLGSLVLAAAIVPRTLLDRVEALVGSADTKETHPLEYWDGLHRRLLDLRGAGLGWDMELCAPSEIDAENLNVIMDRGYERLLRRIPPLRAPGRCRVTLDDYGVRGPLTAFLATLRDSGAEVIVREKADEDSMEVRAASVLARWRRAEEMRQIDADYSLPGAPVGTGGPADSRTAPWLKAWRETGKPWPPVVRKKWKNLKKAL